MTKSESDAVGFQYWYGANGEDEETYEPIKIESVNLTGASCTYTRTMTVPYNKTITKTSNKSLTSGSEDVYKRQGHYLADIFILEG